MNSPNIVLIGMPGAGKSTIGVLLAKALGMSFLDTDLLIQEREGRLLQDIINRDGVAGFLKIEAEVILGLKRSRCVIATGGSAVYREPAVLHLKENGRLVYLELPFAEVAQRINNMSSRGIAIGKGQQLLDIYNERIVLYQKYADVTVNCSGLTIEETVVKIVSSINLLGY